MIQLLVPGGRLYGAAGTSHANILAHWSSLAQAASGVATVSANNGRLGTGYSSLRLGVYGGGHWVHLTKAFNAHASWGIAFGYRAVSTLYVNGTICGFDDSATNQVQVQVNVDQTFSITRNGTVLGTSTETIPINTYAHLEFRATIHPTTGSVALYKNGALIIGPLTNQNTRSTANSTANIVRIGSNTVTGGTTGIYLDYDDIIVYDGQTTDAYGNTAIVGPIGDRSVLARALASDSTYTDFTPNSGTTHYNRLTETMPDGDTTYNESSTVGHRDSFLPAALAGTITAVNAKSIVSFARKTDVGSRQAAYFWRLGGTNYDHPTAIDLGDSYQYHMRIAEKNPASGAAWGLTADELGIKVQS